MKLPRRQFLHLAAGAASLITLTNTPLAQDWPIRPVTMVYPFAAGSAADVLDAYSRHASRSFWARRWSSRMFAAQAA